MTEQPPFAAFVDESGSDQTRDPGTYILSAVVLEIDRLKQVREEMRALILRGQKKLHWREESDPRRLAIAEAVAALELEHVVVIRNDAMTDRPERRRRACLKRLTYELDQLGVGSMTLESRGAADDGRDRVALDGFRRTGSVTTRLRMHHEPGPAEPLLWVPDAVCGAMVGRRTGNPGHWKLLEHQCTIYTCA